MKTEEKKEESVSNRLWEEALKNPLKDLESEGRDGEKSGTLKKTSFLLDQLKDLNPSLILHLYPNHFRLQNHKKEKYPYTKDAKEFLDYIDNGELPFDFIETMEKVSNVPIHYYEGCLIAEIYDHRPSSSPPESSINGNTNENNGKSSKKKEKRKKIEPFRILLKPTYASMINDIEEMKRKRGREMNDDELIKLEQDLLLNSFNEPLCLDPSPEVLLLNNITNFNRKKFKTTKRQKLSAESLIAQDKLEEKKENEKKEVKKGASNLLNFIQKKEKEKGKPPGSSMEMAIHQAINRVLRQFSVQPIATFVPGRNALDLQRSDPLKSSGGNRETDLSKLLNNRKLRFAVNGKVYCTFQVVMTHSGGFSGIIKTAAHDTVEFPIGNSHAAEAAVAQIRALYEKEGSVVECSLEDPEPIPITLSHHTDPRTMGMHNQPIQMSVKLMGMASHPNANSAQAININNYRGQNLNAIASHVLNQNAESSSILDQSKKIVHKLGPGIQMMNFGSGGHPLIQANNVLLAQQNANANMINAAGPLLYRPGSNQQININGLPAGMSSLLQQQAQAQLNANSVNFNPNKVDPKS
eukprot:TRINITY_DN3479_c0_g1_i1.p1 TRINITY_DN3479_c0_g1~~TRINITY_DN3479_c0_g1_i1.p1  ORF type:complete len:620 (-),score=275.24 TRINITY_DN3479_c0_g1_i1:939-2681(-)